MNGEKPKIAAYCRVSTDKDDQLLSLQAQQSFFEGYAVKNDLELVKLYTDEGISGTKLKNRQAFHQMMMDAEKRLFERVYVKDISRMSRNVVDFLQSIRKLRALGVDCQFITANMSIRDGELTLTILAAVAQEESANLSKRVKFGKQKNAEQGRVPNLVFGYNKKNGDYFHLEINPQEADVVRRIFHAYTNDGYGAGKIADRMNTEGILTKRGCRWSQNAVMRILQNPLYIGKIINGKEYIEDFLTGIRKKSEPSKYFITENKALAIVPEIIFEKAQDTILTRQKNIQTGMTRHSCQHLFSTLLKCSCCGYSFRRIERKYQNIYVRWACSGRNTKGKFFCNNGIRVKEEQLLYEITNYIIRKVPFKRIEKKVFSLVQKEYRIKQSIEQERIEEELIRLKKAKRKQTEMFEVDVITAQELKERVSSIHGAIRIAEEKLAANFTDKTEDGNFLQSTYQGRLLSAAVLNNMALKMIVEKILVSPEGKIIVDFRKLSSLSL